MGKVGPNTGRSLRAQMISGTGWSFIGVVADYGASFLITFLVARPLGPAKYGHVPLVAGIIEVPQLVLVAVLGTSMARHIAALAGGDPGRARQWLRAGLILMVPFGIVAAVLCAAGADAIALAYHSPELAGMLRIAAVTLSAAGIVAFTQAAFQGLGRLDLLSGSAVLNSATRLVVTLVLVLGLRLGAPGAVWGTALGFVVAALVAFPVLLLICWPRGKSTGPLPWGPLLGYARPLLLSSMAFFAFTRIDILILGVFAQDSSEVGYLGLASTALAVALTVGQAATNAAFPSVSALAARKDHGSLQRLFDQSSYWLTMYSVPACIAFIVLARPLLNLVMPAYAPVADLLRILSPLIVLRTLSALCTAGYLIAAGQARQVARLNVIGALANVLLDLILIPPFGAKGSAIGTLIAHGGIALVSIWLMRRRLGISMGIPWGIVSGAVVMLAIVLRAHLLQFDTTVPGACLYYLMGLAGFLGVSLVFMR